MMEKRSDGKRENLKKEERKCEGELMKKGSKDIRRIRKVKKNKNTRTSSCSF